MNKSLSLLLGCVLATVLSFDAFADDHHDHRGRDREYGEHHPGPPRGVAPPHVRMEIDAHFGHNRYYPPAGVGFRVLPSGYYTTRFRGAPYYFHEGIWYRHGGLGYTVVRPPAGLFINVLPPFYTTVWFGGIPYYYADNVYYRWEAPQRGYVVSEPPVASDTDNNATATSPDSDIYVYPKNGQSDEQKATDRYDCYRWATDQTGFDPTKTAGGVNDADIADKRDQYRRAEAACLEGRGYTVK